MYGDVHRFEGYGEETADFAFTESPYSASKIAGEALVYAYARCYDLRYLVFRFSNVYGRFDNDLRRMSRVIPRFIHEIASGTPITIYGGADKVLDFTYVDDCVDGIARGVEALRVGRVENETINLAFGEGNTLVRAAELIGETLGVDPNMTSRPRSSARSRGTSPTSARPATCSAGSRRRRSASGFRRPFAGSRSIAPRTPRTTGTCSPRPSTTIEIVGIFGPTASGKSAVAECLADLLCTEVVSADAMQVYRGLPILTNQPDRPTRLVAFRAIDEAMSVGHYAPLAHGAIDEVVERAGVAVVAGGTGLYFRAALADLAMPPAVDRATRDRIEAEVAADPAAAHARLSGLDPRAAASVHVNDRRRVDPGTRARRGRRLARARVR